MNPEILIVGVGVLALSLWDLYAKLKTRNQRLMMGEKIDVDYMIDALARLKKRLKRDKNGTS